MARKYSVDRKNASRLLSVSLRTLDRYVAEKKLSSIKKSGRIWLNEEELLDLKRENEAGDIDVLTNSLWDEIDEDAMITETYALNKDNEEEVEELSQVKTKKQDPIRNATTDSVLYRELYLDAKEKLEQANLKIQQLEAQIGTMIPLLEYQKQQRLLQESADLYKKKWDESEKSLLSHIEETEKTIRGKNKEIAEERFNKAIIAVILFVVLFLQPILWILLR